MFGKIILVIIGLTFIVSCSSGSNTAFNGIHSKEYYTATLGSQLNAKLHGLDTDTKGMVVQEVTNTFFNYLHYKLDRVHVNTLLGGNAYEVLDPLEGYN